jgi:6-phosphogluconolactonase
VNKERQSGPHAHFITTDPQNRIVLACDLGLDKVLLYDGDTFKGALKPHDPAFGSVPAGAGPRHLVFHPGGKWVYVINEMGSSITLFDYNAKRGALAERQTISTLPENFSGANSTAEIQIHPSGKFVYGSNRGHNSIAIFRVDEKTGALTRAGHQSSGGKTPRHFALAPSGKWLLAENQDSHNIVTFALDEKSGGLTPTGHSVEVGSPVCLRFLTQ